MSFEKLRVPELLSVAEEFGVELNPGATKPVIIAALVEEGVTWDMAKTFDKAAAAVEEEEVSARAGVITSDALREPAVQVSVDPVVETVPTTTVVNAVPDGYILVPKGQDGYVKDGVFYPGALPVAAPARPEVVLIKMERENPSYEVRGYKFTKTNPFVLVKDRDVDFVLRHEVGFKVASPREAQEFYK